MKEKISLQYRRNKKTLEYKIDILKNTCQNTKLNTLTENTMIKNKLKLSDTYPEVYHWMNLYSHLLDKINFINSPTWL